MPASAADETPRLNHRLPAEEIPRKLAAAMAACDEQLNLVATTPDSQRTFANTPEAIEHALAMFSDVAQRLGILKEIHPAPDVRDAAATAEETAGQYAVKVGARRDLYRAVTGYL